MSFHSPDGLSALIVSVVRGMRADEQALTSQAHYCYYCGLPAGWLVCRSYSGVRAPLSRHPSVQSVGLLSVLPGGGCGRCDEVLKIGASPLPGKLLAANGTGRV